MPLKTGKCGKEIRSAVIVDFDNMFGCFQNQNRQFAEDFAFQAEKWLQWLEKSMDSQQHNKAKRRIICRRCYMNPKAFWRYRDNFTNAGFKVIDCSPVAQTKKTSADMHMTVDIMKLIHESKYDEIIILSADVDFQPILLELRENNWRTVILPVGASAIAYRSAADHVIDPEVFIKDAIYQGQTPPASYKDPYSEEYTQDEVKAAIKNIVQSSNSPVNLPDLGNLLREKFPNLSKRWFGAGTLKNFISRLNLQPVEMLCTGEICLYDPNLHNLTQE